MPEGHGLRTGLPQFRAYCLFLLLVSFLTRADAKALIRMGTMAPEGSTWHDALLQIRQDWRRISNGEVELRIYAGGVLGDEAEMIRKVQRRGLDAVAISGAGLSRVDVGVSALTVPMMFESYEELDDVRSQLAPELEKRIEKSNFKVLNWSDAGWVHFFSKKPARTISDIQGMKLWTSAGDPDTEKLFKDLGFTVVPLPATDMLTALQTGLIEAIEVPPLFAMLDGTYKQANHMIDLKWVPLLAATVISTHSWQQIPEQYREPLLKASRDAGERLRAKIRAAGDDAVKEMKARGLNVVTVDEATLAKWRSQVRDSYPKLRGTLAPADLFDQALRLRDQYRAQRGGQD
jgi:TRAP-type C4-dicarboxylate transport system substrate-binding protein